MNSYSYFTAPTNEFAHDFCPKCTSSYGCVCSLLIAHGNCPTCMNAPAKCLCKELSTQQTASGSRWVPTETPGGFRLESDASGNYMNFTYVEPVIKDRAKWQMNYFWKEACKAEGVSFTRKEHCAYPRVLATYRRLRKEYEEQSEKIMREQSSGW